MNIYESFSGHANKHLSSAIDFLNKELEIKTTTGNVRAVVNHTAKCFINLSTAPFCALISIAALVESVVRHSLAISVKIFTFFIPAQCAISLDTKVIIPLFNHGKFSSEAFFKSFVRIFTNFLGEKSRKKADEAIAFDKLYSNAFCQKLIHFHFTGDSRNDNKVEPSNLKNVQREAAKEGPSTKAVPIKTPQENKQRFWSLDTLKNTAEYMKSHLPSMRTAIIGTVSIISLAVISHIAYSYFESIPKNICKIGDEPQYIAKARLERLARALNLHSKSSPSDVPAIWNKITQTEKCIGSIHLPQNRAESLKVFDCFKNAFSLKKSDSSIIDQIKTFKPDTHIIAQHKAALQTQQFLKKITRTEKCIGSIHLPQNHAESLKVLDCFKNAFSLKELNPSIIDQIKTLKPDTHIIAQHKAALQQPQQLSNKITQVEKCLGSAPLPKNRADCLKVFDCFKNAFSLNEAKFSSPDNLDSSTIDQIKRLKPDTTIIDHLRAARHQWGYFGVLDSVSNCVGFTRLPKTPKEALKVFDCLKDGFPKVHLDSPRAVTISLSERMQKDSPLFAQLHQMNKIIPALQKQLKTIDRCLGKVKLEDIPKYSQLSTARNRLRCLGKNFMKFNSPKRKIYRFVAKIVHTDQLSDRFLPDRKLQNRLSALMDFLDRN